MKAFWTCDRRCLSNRKGRVLQDVLKSRAEKSAVRDQSRLDGWRKTARRRDSVRRGVVNKRERLRNHPCPLFSLPS